VIEHIPGQATSSKPSQSSSGTSAMSFPHTAHVHWFGLPAGTHTPGPDESSVPSHASIGLSWTLLPHVVHVQVTATISGTSMVPP
jgi:hypothetical protein